MKICNICKKIYSNKFVICECGNELTNIDNSKSVNINVKTNLISKEDDTIHCPKCGSTQIHADRRGWKVTTGLLGSSKILITCLKCGKQWKAGSF